MENRRSVVLLTVDSIRADHCGFMGYERDTTPTLDALAADGLVFENAVATAPATHGSATTFLTGEHPVERPGSSGTSGSDMQGHIRGHMNARESVAEQFSRAGYETAAFTANPWTSRFFGFDDGFDHFQDFMDEDVSRGLFEDADADSGVASLVANAMNWWRGQNMFMSWEAFYDEIVEWTESADEPYFLWIFLVDVHLPYLPGGAYQTQSKLATYPANLWLFSGRDADRPLESWSHDVLTTAYDNTIRYTDEFVDRLTTDLEDDDPLLVFHGDHGDAFGEHGMYGHGRQLYEELVHVPLLVANGPTDRVTEPLSLRRLPGLLRSLATDGDYERHTEPWAVSRNRMPRVGVRGEEWKYIWSPDRNELYDLTAGEDDDLLVTESTDRRTRELQSIGRDIEAAYHADKAERERIVEAAQTVAAEERV
ncbi:MAG: sulfatase [Haloferacaceae archaeon]